MDVNPGARSAPSGGREPRTAPRPAAPAPQGPGSRAGSHLLKSLKGFWGSGEFYTTLLDHEGEAGGGYLAGLEELRCALDPQGLQQVCRDLTKLQALGVATADLPLPKTLTNLCRLTCLHCELSQGDASPLCGPEMISLLTNLRSLRCGLDDEGLRRACYCLTALEDP